MTTENKKTTDEADAAALDGTELVRLVQGGVNVKATVNQIKDLTGSSVRTPLEADTTIYVRKHLGFGTISHASPAVAHLVGHNLSAGDRVVFSGPLDDATTTVTIASPAVWTQVGHPFDDDDPVELFTTDAGLPTGFAVSTTYYVKKTGADTFNLAATPGGSAINSSGAQSGVHYVHRKYSIPGGIREGNPYYVISAGLGPDDFQFSATLGGTAINTTSDQIGKIGFSTGDDDNDGLSVDAALLQPQRASDMVSYELDLQGNTPTIQLAKYTTYVDEVFFQFFTQMVQLKTLEGAGTAIAVFQGDHDRPGNVKLMGSGRFGYCVTISGPTAAWSIDGIRVETEAGGDGSTKGIAVFGQGATWSSHGCNIEYSGELDDLTECQYGAFMDILGGRWIVHCASTGYALECVNRGRAHLQTAWDFTGALSIDAGGAFIWCGYAEVIFFKNGTSNGGNTVTGQRFDVNSNGKIHSTGGDVNYIFGSVKGRIRHAGSIYE